MNDDNGIWMRPVTTPVVGDYGPEDMHMCTICHALTPRNNSGPHYAWHAQQTHLLAATQAILLEMTMESEEDK
jgi:hypothetical protein